MIIHGKLIILSSLRTVLVLNDICCIHKGQYNASQMGTKTQKFLLISSFILHIWNNRLEKHEDKFIMTEYLFSSVLSFKKKFQLEAYLHLITKKRHFNTGLPFVRCTDSYRLVELLIIILYNSHEILQKSLSNQATYYWLM